MATALLTMSNSNRFPGRLRKAGNNGYVGRDQTGDGPPLLKRVSGLVARAGILALGLSLGGVGPVLGSSALDAGHSVTLYDPTDYDAAYDTGFVIPNTMETVSSGGGADHFDVPAPASDAALKDAISDPLVWGEWRLVTAGREQVMGIGTLHPGAKPEMMKERATTLELRFYMPY